MACYDFIHYCLLFAFNCFMHLSNYHLICYNFIYVIIFLLIYLLTFQQVSSGREFSFKKFFAFVYPHSLVLDDWYSWLVSFSFYFINFLMFFCHYYYLYGSFPSFLLRFLDKTTLLFMVFSTFKHSTQPPIGVEAQLWIFHTASFSHRGKEPRDMAWLTILKSSIMLNNSSYDHHKVGYRLTLPYTMSIECISTNFL